MHSRGERYANPRPTINAQIQPSQIRILSKPDLTQRRCPANMTDSMMQIMAENAFVQ